MMRAGIPPFVVRAMLVGLLYASLHCSSAGNTGSSPRSTASHDASTSTPSPDSGSESVGPPTPDGSSDASLAEDAGDALPDDADDASADDGSVGEEVTGTLYQITIPQQGSLNGPSNYYAWVPDGSAPVRSIIVHQHGCTREGDAPLMVHDLHWLQLAKKWRSVFIARDPHRHDAAPGPLRAERHFHKWKTYVDMERWRQPRKRLEDLQHLSQRCSPATTPIQHGNLLYQREGLPALARWRPARSFPCTEHDFHGFGTGCLADLCLSGECSGLVRSRRSEKSDAHPESRERRGATAELVTPARCIVSNSSKLHLMEVSHGRRRHK
jgi:hypothetical protein